MNPTGDLLSRRQLSKRSESRTATSAESASRVAPMAPAPVYRQEGLLSAGCRGGLAVRQEALCQLDVTPTTTAVRDVFASAQVAGND